MAIQYVLSFFDGLTAFTLLSFVYLGWFSPGIILYHALYLVLKGLFFIKGDIGSKLDFLIGIYMFSVSIGVSITILTVVSSIWLVYKFIISFITPFLNNI